MCTNSMRPVNIHIYSALCLVREFYPRPDCLFADHTAASSSLGLHNLIMNALLC